VLEAGHSRCHSGGFTLIELMIAIALLAILLLLGVPAFSGYLQNAKLRSAAETFYGGVQMARTEAVRRNASVQIALTTDFPDVTAANTTNLSATAPNWLIRFQPDPTVVQYTFVEGKSGFAGSGQAAGTTPQVQIAGSAASVVFNGFGRANTAATFDFSNPTGGACAPTGPMRCLRVVVSLGGQGRLCDPAVTAQGDTRAC
jgi:type IV fimbrial biogenesis protein FimT